MNSLRSRKGATSPGSVIFLLVIGTAIYVAIMMAIPQIKYYQVEQLFKDQAIRLKLANVDEVRKAVEFKLSEIGVPLAIEDVEIIKEKGTPPAIQAEYSEDVVFITGYTYTYTFQPRGEAPKSAGYN